jgi:outer membrane protein
MENITTNESPVKNTNEEKCCDHKNCKCCLNLTLNIIAIVGVIVLFVLYFTGKSGKKQLSKKMDNSSLVIGFINSDSLMKNYELVKTVKDSFGAKQKIAEDNFGIQQKAFEAKVADYQSKMKSNTLSITQAQSVEKQLAQEQEQLYALKDQLTQELSAEELKMSTMIQDTIVSFIKKFNKKYNYDYILGFSKGGGILYANDSLDITKDILKELNKDYKKK